MKKRLICLLLAVVMLVPLAACGGAGTAADANSDTHTIVDLLGREIAVPNEIKNYFLDKQIY